MCGSVGLLMSTFSVLYGPLRKIHRVVASLMFEEMVFACEAIVALAGTVVHIAVNKLDLVSRREVTSDICFARESRNTAFPFAWYSIRRFSAKEKSLE